MEILVIDGQGGGLGRQLVAAVKKAVPQAVVTVIGTNSAATSAMLKAGADRAATGENAVVVGLTQHAALYYNNINRPAGSRPCGAEAPNILVHAAPYGR